MAEGGILPPIVLELRAKATEVFSELGKVRSELDETNKKAQEAGQKGSSAFDKMAGYGKALTVGLIGVAGAVGGFSVEAATSAEVVDAKLRTAIQNAGGSMEELEPKIQSLDGSMRKYGFTNDQTNTALSSMTTALKDPAKAMQAMSVAADLAKAKNLDLNTASMLVAKAMEGQTRPLKALGIDLPIAQGNSLAVANAQTALAAAQQKVNDILAKFPDAANPASKAHSQYQKATEGVKAAQDKLTGAQGAGGDILKELTSRVHGAADAYGNTLQGKMAAARAGVESMAESLGKMLIPWITKAIGVATQFIGWLDNHRPVLYAIAAIFGTVMVTAIGAYIAAKARALASDLKTFAESLGKAAVWAGTKIGLFTSVGAAAEASSATQIAATEAVSVAEEEGAVVAEEAGAAQALAFGPIGLAIMAIVAIVVLLVTHWKQAWGAIKVAFEAVWNFLKGAWDWIKTIFLDYFKAEIKVFQVVWTAVWGGIKDAFSAVWDFLKEAWNWIKTIFLDYFIIQIRVLEAVWNAVWDGISKAISWVWGNVLSPIWSGIKGAISAVGSAIQWFGNLWNSVWNAVSSAIQWVWNNVISPIVNFIEGAFSKIQGVIHGIGSAIGGVAKFLGFADGGEVPGPKGAPRLAVVHGGEYVLSNEMLAGRQAPEGLDKAMGSSGPSISARALSGPPAPAQGGGGTSVTVIAQTNATPAAIASSVGWELRKRAS